jgi:hypothetical protein
MIEIARREWNVVGSGLKRGRWARTFGGEVEVIVNGTFLIRLDGRRVAFQLGVTVLEV